MLLSCLLHDRQIAACLYNHRWVNWLVGLFCFHIQSRWVKQVLQSFTLRQFLRLSGLLLLKTYQPERKNTMLPVLVNGTFFYVQQFGCWSETQQRRAEINDIFLGHTNNDKNNC